MPSSDLKSTFAGLQSEGMAQGLFLSQKMMLSQVLAPQLQQSLVLLQAPTLELKALVEQELQQNPVLEELAVTEEQQELREPKDDDRLTSDPAEPPAEMNYDTDPAEPPADVNYDPGAEKESAAPVDDFQAEFERLSQLDQEWRDHFNQGSLPLRQKEDDEEKRQFMFENLTAGESLQENLLQQMRLSELSEAQCTIVEMLIGNIDERGYLQASLDELAFSTNIPADEIATMLKVIQSFHPPGVGARDLRECLMLQLERAEKQDSLEYRIIRDHLEALGRRRLPDIAKALADPQLEPSKQISVGDVQQAAERISHLEPHPGREFTSDHQQYVVAEIFVIKVGDEYVVTNNNDYIPHLRISNAYKDIMSQSDSTTEVRDYIRDKIRAGKFLIKSLFQRQQTILNIAKEIVIRQRDFLEKGITQLKPMTMLQVAEVVGVHETTVSRAVAGKYMETPQGIYEMKFFFTSGIHTSTGGSVSNTSIKDMLNEMVRKEDTNSPLSDEQIVQMMKQKGIMIARRTVAQIPFGTQHSAVHIAEGVLISLSNNWASAAGKSNRPNSEAATQRNAAQPSGRGSSPAGKVQRKKAQKNCFLRVCMFDFIDELMHSDFNAQFLS